MTEDVATPWAKPEAGSVSGPRLGLSLDVWAVLLALVLALLVKTSVLRHVAW